MKTQLEIVSEWRDALSAEGLSSFDAFMHVRGGEPVSRHRHRETIPLDVPFHGASRRCYLKRVFWVPPKHAIWPLTRGRLGRSQPWREWHNIAALQAAGIPTMNRIAMSERRSFGRPVDAFILVEGVPETHTLAEWIVPGYPRPPDAGRVDLGELFHALGQCIGRLHATSFNWPDIHAKHIFASPTSGGGSQKWSVRLIDLERVVMLPRGGILFDEESRWLNLDSFFESLEPLTIQSVLLQSFSRAYIATSPEADQESLQGWFASVHEGHRSSIRLPDGYVHPDRSRLHADDGIWADATAMPALRKQKLGSLDAVFAYYNGTPMGKPGLAQHRERIRVDISDSVPQSVAYLKRYHRPPVFQQINRMWETRPRRSTAWREAHFIRELGRLGISTMRCLAWGEEMRGRWEQRSFILTEGIHGESLERLAARTRQPLDVSGQRLKRDIIEQLAAITAKLHGNNLFHRDLYLSHVFLTHNRDGKAVLRLIDLARMVRQSPLRRRRIKDLAALDYSSPAPLVTRADRLRFLNLYARSYHVDAPPGGLRACLREIAHAVRRRTAWMARHDANRRRRLNIETTP